MNNQNKLALHFALITVLLGVFGAIFKQNPFEALSVYLMIVGVVLIGSTIVSLPFHDFKYSLNAILFGIFLLVSSVIAEGIWPSPPIKTYSQDEMGNHPKAEWQFQLFYKNQYDILDSSIFKFKGTTYESKIALQGTIEKWDKEHPDTPIINHYRVLTYIPREYAKQNKYPLTFAGEF